MDALSTDPTDDTRRATVISLERGTTLASATAFYDSLPPVRVEDLMGSWKGSGIGTGNPLDGMLENFGWHGKRFDGPDDAHPLVFDGRRGTLFSVNPALLPMGLIMKYARLLRNPIVPRLFAAVNGLMRTQKPEARLRLTEYRGVVSATMIYDDLAINDVFRRVDADTLMGLMDMRGMDSPFAFVLRRESPVATTTGVRP